MSWVDDNKGTGPWDFIEQPDKFGYLNNERWSSQQDAIDFCEAKGLSLDLPNQHLPCGHWHKGPIDEIPEISLGPNWWWQPSIDVRDGIIGVVAMYNDNVPEDRIVGLIYDKSTKTWKCLGYSYIQVISAEPNTCRLSENYMAFYCMCNTWEDWEGEGDWNRYFGRLYIFESGHDPRYSDPWECNWSTKIPYKIYQYQIYNVMDCADDRIACAALVLGIDGVACYKWMIKVSDDRGISFHTEYSMPNADIPGGGGYIDKVHIRMSADGIIWIAYLRANPTNKIIELWKSNADATSFNKIWETDYSALMDSQQAAKMVFDVSDSDGEKVTISLLALSGGIFYRVTYYSTDHGITFNSNVWAVADYSTTGKGAVNGAHVLLNVKKISINDYFFMLSSDYGSSYNEVDPDVPDFNLYYADCQKYNAEVVYTECSASFVEGSDQQGLLSSEDYGANWEVISMPIYLVPTDNQPVIWDGGPSEGVISEPQIWTMPE
jgi:hypothetical protein